MSARVNMVSVSIEDPEDIYGVRRSGPRPFEHGDGVHPELFHVNAAALQMLLRREAAEALVARLRAALDEPVPDDEEPRP